MRLIRLLKNDLARESSEWVDEGIIDQSQAELICARYGADYHQGQHHSFGYRVLIGLGYLFIGLAVITLIGANWDEIPRALRMSGLVVLTLATQLIGWHQFTKGQPESAAGFVFLGNLFYGASIILIAQIYHLGEHMPDGIFYWALGSLLPSLLLQSPWLMLSTLVLGLIWFFVEAGVGFYPTLFPLFLLAAYWVLSQPKPNVLLFMVTAIATGLWLEYTLAWLWGNNGFYVGPEHLVVSAALFITAYARSKVMAATGSVTVKDYGAVLHVWCLRFTALGLLIFSFDDPWKALIKDTWPHLVSMSLICAALVAWSVFELIRARINSVPFFTLVLFVFVTTLIAVTSEDRSYGLYLQVADNVMLIMMGIYLIQQGIKQTITHYFFLGVLIILLTGFLRYIDLIGDYVGGALLFLFFAAILLGSAKYWRKVQLGGANV